MASERGASPCDFVTASLDRAAVLVHRMPARLPGARESFRELDEIGPDTLIAACCAALDVVRLFVACGGCAGAEE